ncbi:hypothetical protein [Salinispira pacifica]|uniref:ABC transporter protein n=1 Tax=Salinispira pacifica TaxID=1307761 RepID=V5WEW0_9SPIO|nr:hypothetical protein [Salinispira pacifica]AHC14069.1 ABC transporter protein [Salinispira pacifica]
MAVEHRINGTVKKELLFPEKDGTRIAELLQSGKVETMHSQEATLEQIFIQLTGRGLA